MGYLQEKYDHNYFINHAKPMSPEYVASIIRSCGSPIDRKFLEIGFGDGVIAHEIIKLRGIYTGIDFAPAALQLTAQRLGGLLKECNLYQGDALAFMKDKQYDSEFDVVIMIHTVEHIPASEVNELLPLISKAVKRRGIFVCVTPLYNVDEDIIAQDGVYIDPSYTDTCPATSGCHCNKYTSDRLNREIEAHRFVQRGNYRWQKY